MLSIVLNFFEYRYLIGSLDTEIYTAIVATLFTAIGIWIGINLLKQSRGKKHDETEINYKGIKEFKLNQREYEILKLISDGLSNQEIADKLFIALPTVKTHTSNLYSKMDVRSRTQAVKKAQSLHLI